MTPPNDCVCCWGYPPASFRRGNVSRNLETPRGKDLPAARKMLKRLLLFSMHRKVSRTRDVVRRGEATQEV